MRLGIDIGTHAARAAYLDADGRPCLVRMPGGDALPAYARQTMHGLVVGDEAAQALVGNMETTVCGCTRLMGRAGNLAPQLLERLAFPVREQGGEAVCNLLYAEVGAGEIYGRLVRALCDAAERQLGEPVESVVLAVPAVAEDRFRVQARAAAERHGVRVHRIVSQPAAALTALRPAAERVAVIGCGGGATEVSVAERSPEGWRVLTVVGDALLGGDDLCWAMAEGLNERFRRAVDLDIFHVGSSQVAALGLRAAAEEALVALADASETQLVLDHGGGFGRDLVTSVSQPDAERWLRPLLERVAGLCARALASAPRTRRRPVDAVVLTGDWAWLPQLRQAIASAFGVPAAELHLADAATLAVSGAALAAAGAAQVWDVTPFPLGINCYYGETELFSPIVRANTPIPTPPCGAAGGYTESYTTRFPDQTVVRLDVLQYRGERSAEPLSGEQVTPDECELLGSWEFRGLRPSPGQCAAFKVSFAVDADGILQLQARETATGRTLEARVERGIG